MMTLRATFIFYQRCLNQPCLNYEYVAQLFISCLISIRTGSSWFKHSIYAHSCSNHARSYQLLILEAPVGVGSRTRTYRLCGFDPGCTAGQQISFDVRVGSILEPLISLAGQRGSRRVAPNRSLGRPTAGGKGLSVFLLGELRCGQVSAAVDEKLQQVTTSHLVVWRKTPWWRSSTKHKGE